MGLGGVELSQASRSGYRRALYRDFSFRCSSYLTGRCVLAEVIFAGAMAAARICSSTIARAAPCSVNSALARPPASGASLAAASDSSAATTPTDREELAWRAPTEESGSRSTSRQPY